MNSEEDGLENMAPLNKCIIARGRKYLPLDELGNVGLCYGLINVLNHIFFEMYANNLKLDFHYASCW